MVAKKERPKVLNLGDSGSIKRLLDDTACTAVTEDIGYREKHFNTNFKIVLGAAACACAIGSQLYPVPYPDNKWVLVACVLGYLTLNLVLFLHSFYVEQSYLLTTFPWAVEDQDEWEEGKTAEECGLSPPGTEDGVRIQSRMPRYQDVYGLLVCAATGEGDKAERPAAYAYASITRWFDVDGQLDEDGFKSFVKDLVGKYERGEGQGEAQYEGTLDSALEEASAIGKPTGSEGGRSTGAQGEATGGAKEKKKTR